MSAHTRISTEDLGLNGKISMSFLTQDAIKAAMTELLANMNYEGGIGDEVMSDPHLAKRQVIFTTAMYHLFGVEDAESLANGSTVKVKSGGKIIQVSKFHAPQVLPTGPISYEVFRSKLDSLPQEVCRMAGMNGNAELKGHVQDVADNIDRVVQGIMNNPEVARARV